MLLLQLSIKTSKSMQDYAIVQILRQSSKCTNMRFGIFENKEMARMAVIAFSQEFLLNQ